MDERRPEPDPDERDERASKPPGEGESDEPAATEAPGPHGNPGVSEEALRNRQQDES